MAITVTINPELRMHGSGHTSFEQDIKIEMPIATALLLAKCAETSHYDVLKNLAHEIEAEVAKAFPSGRIP